VLDIGRVVFHTDAGLAVGDETAEIDSAEAGSLLGSITSRVEGKACGVGGSRSSGSTAQGQLDGVTAGDYFREGSRGGVRDPELANAALQETALRLDLSRDGPATRDGGCRFAE
jgi:hypothetical protein